MRSSTINSTYLLIPKIQHCPFPIPYQTEIILEKPYHTSFYGSTIGEDFEDKDKSKPGELKTPFHSISLKFHFSSPLRTILYENKRQLF